MMSEDFLRTINDTDKTNSQLRSPEQDSLLAASRWKRRASATMAMTADENIPGVQRSALERTRITQLWGNTSLES